METIKQERQTCGWIAGFVDGEGYIGLWKGRQGKHITYVPVVSISNTHHDTILHLSEQLKNLGIGNHIYTRNVENPKWRQRMIIEIRGMKRVKKFLATIKPFSVTKQEQIELLEQYIDKRLEKPLCKPYDGSEEETFEKLKMLKHA